MTETSDRPAQQRQPGDKPRSASAKRVLSLVVLIVALTGVIILFACSNSNGSAPPTSKKEKPGANEQPATTTGPVAGTDYSKFSHSEGAHSRLPCLLCHRREGNPIQPIRSVGHTPCAGCHAQQFQQSSGPMCTICHVNVEAGDRSIKPFPELESFNMVFDHSEHRGVSCSKCHRAERKGVAQSIPAGLDAHKTCYECHAPRAQADGRDISSCSTCHKPGSYSPAPEWSKGYGVGFSHAKHNSGKGINCAECHGVRAGAQNGVSSPAPLMHHARAGAQSCQSCHNNKRAFGEDFASCKRCHQGQTFRF